MMRSNQRAASAGALLVVSLLAVGTGAAGAAAATPAPGPTATARVGAQVVVGQTGTPLNCAPGGSTWVQQATGAAAPGYVVPGPGVITSFSHNANATPGSVRAVAVRPGSGPSNRVVVGVSALQAVTPSTLNTFATRIPVPAGAGLAIYATATNMGCFFGTADTADVVTGSAMDPSVSSSYTPLPANTFHQYRLNLSVVWEPDVDKDSYGDVTQDLCPQSAQTQAACPAPDTTITKAPARRSSKREAKIKFSSVPGATFTCAVDGKTAKPCASPFKRRYRYEKHRVVVTAISSVGIPDPTPATVTFKVKPPSQPK